jgi:hypothetical protein
VEGDVAAVTGGRSYGGSVQQRGLVRWGPTEGAGAVVTGGEAWGGDDLQRRQGRR